VCDHLIEAAAGNGLTDRFGARDASTLTDIGRPEGPVTSVIAHGHAIPADPTEREALEEGGALARGTPASVAADGLGILQQPPLVLFELLPGNVAGMRLRDQGGPFLTREPLGDVAAVDGVAMPTAAKKERARVARIMKNPEGTPML
jgi:hypothetical protein